MKFSRLLGALGVLFLLNSELAFAGVGTIHRTYGEVMSSGEVVDHGKPLDSGMTITTGLKSYAVLTFDDGQVIALGAESELYIQNYSYDANKPGRSYSHLSLIRGGLRYISGELAKLRPDAIEIKTPTATMNVRGTDFLVGLGSLYVQVNNGQVEMSNRTGSQILNSGETGYAKSLVTEPATISVSQLPAIVVRQFETLMNIPVSDVAKESREVGVAAGNDASDQASGSLLTTAGVVAGGAVILGVVLSLTKNAF